MRQWQTQGESYDNQRSAWRWQRTVRGNGGQGRKAHTCVESARTTERGILVGRPTPRRRWMGFALSSWEKLKFGLLPALAHKYLLLPAYLLQYQLHQKDLNINKIFMKVIEKKLTKREQ